MNPNNFEAMIPDMKEPAMISATLPTPDFEERGDDKAIVELYSALSQATAKFGEVKKTEEVKIKTKDGSYMFRYAPLEELLSSTRPALSEFGLVVMMPFIRTMEDVTKQLLIIAHKSGARLVFSFPFHAAEDTKTFGGQTTYYQRYAYRSALCLAADSDLDEMPEEKRGETGAQRATAQPKQAPQQSSSAPQARPQATQAQPKQTPAEAPKSASAPTGPLATYQELADIKALARSSGLQKMSDLSNFIFGAIWSGEVRFLGDPYLSALTSVEANKLLEELTKKRTQIMGGA